MIWILSLLGCIDLGMNEVPQPEPPTHTPPNSTAGAATANVMLPEAPASASVAFPPPDPPPSVQGQVVVRNCSTAETSDMLRGFAPSGGSSAGASGSGGGAIGAIGGGASSSGFGSGGAPRAVPSAAAPAPAPSARKDAAPSSAAAEYAPGDDGSLTTAQPARRAPMPEPEWGATVYLSNDDSMSLASAQRLLWALENRGPVEARHIRPHEFLNYFGFDTAPVDPAEVFSVRGAASMPTPNDPLTLAFAVQGATPPRAALDLTLVLDRSGSMRAEGRMDYLKRGLTRMTEQLLPGDRVDLVLFDDEVCTPLENYVVGRDEPALLRKAIADLEPRGSTDLDAGLRAGYRIANKRTDASGRNRRMLLISDALLNTGDVDPHTVSEIGKAYEASGIRLSAIGVGRDFNDKVLDMLTEKGKGAYVYLGSEAVVDRVFGKNFPSLVQTIAHDVRFALDLPPTLAMKRFYGEEASTNPEDVMPIHYYAGTAQLFLVDLQVRGATAPSDPITLTISWNDVATGEARTRRYPTTVGALLASDRRNLDKGRALMAWTDLLQARALGQDPCGAPFVAWDARLAAVGGDAELQWLDGLTRPLCPNAAPRPPMPPESGRAAFTVKIDSDQAIALAELSCAGSTEPSPLGTSDTVARFTRYTPGSCTVTLHGNVPMRTAVEVPAVGGSSRCVVRAGAIQCR